MSSTDDRTDIRPEEFHPTFLHSRREAWLIFLVWFLCLCWAVPYCYLYGYLPDDFDPEKLETVWGIPRWSFFGIVVPWLVADVFATWFCFRFMQDDDLGEAHEGADIEEEIRELHEREGGE